MNRENLEKILENERDWRLHILTEVTAIKSKQGEHSKEIAGLMVKSGIWGLLGGGIPVLITLTLYALKSEGVIK